MKPLTGIDKTPCLHKHRLKPNMGSKTKLGRIVLIDNNDKKPNEAPLYYRIWTEDEFGDNEEALFLTPTEMERIKKRTQRNKEDWGKRGWLQDALD